MAVQASTLPANLPATAHLHQMNFVLPVELIDESSVFILLRELLGEANPIVKKEFGRRRQFNSYYTLRNSQGAVLVTVYAGGTGIFKGMSAVSINGLCFETWSSHNPLAIDIARLIELVFSKQGWFTRIDVALNDYRRVIDWEEMIECSDKTRYRDRIITRLCKTKPPYYCRQIAESIYFGSNKSKTQVLAYVKQDAEMTKFPWIRIETKIRGKQQCNHIACLLADGMDIFTLAKGILAYNLTFVEGIDSGTIGKRKRQVCLWWSQFVGVNLIRLTPVDSAEPNSEKDHLEVVF